MFWNGDLRKNYSHNLLSWIYRAPLDLYSQAESLKFLKAGGDGGSARPEYDVFEICCRIRVQTSFSSRDHLKPSSRGRNCVLDLCPLVDLCLLRFGLLAIICNFWTYDASFDSIDSGWPTTRTCSFDTMALFRVSMPTFTANLWKYWYLACLYSLCFHYSGFLLWASIAVVSSSDPSGYHLRESDFRGRHFEHCHSSNSEKLRGVAQILKVACTGTGSARPWSWHWFPSSFLYLEYRILIVPGSSFLIWTTAHFESRLEDFFLSFSFALFFSVFKDKINFFEYLKIYVFKIIWK